MIDNTNDETNYPYKLLLINRQLANLRNVFPNNSLRNIKLLKTQVYKIIQLEKK